jgi:hypothetical protein
MSCATQQRLTTQLAWLHAELSRLDEDSRATAAARLRLDCRIEQVTSAYLLHISEHGC